VFERWSDCLNYTFVVTIRFKLRCDFLVGSWYGYDDYCRCFSFGWLRFLDTEEDGECMCERERQSKSEAILSCVA